VAGAQCVKADLALDALDVDGLRLTLHRHQQVRGAGLAVYFVAHINVVLRGQTLHAGRQVDCLPEIIEPFIQRHHQALPDMRAAADRMG